MKYLIFILLLVGCKTTKTVETDVKVQIDSVYYFHRTVVQPPLLSSLSIEICDSVTNKPVKFRKTIVVNGDTLKLYTENNNLKFELIQLQKILSKTDSINKSSEFTHVKTSDTVIIKKVTPKWVWWVMIIQFATIVVFVAFPAIPKWIRRALF